MSSVSDNLKEQLVSDYFTPNIKAEVIFDTLLTPYIEGIVEKGLGLPKDSLTLIAKELSVDDKSDSGGDKESKEEQAALTEEQSGSDERSQENNRGNKVDYVLADEDNVYLVELKTSESSITKEQLEVYKRALKKNSPSSPTFGTVLGERLIKILSKDSPGFNIEISTNADELSDNTLRDLWDKICEKRTRYDPDMDEEIYKSWDETAKKSIIAKSMIKNYGWPWRKSYSSRKYLFSLGMIIDYLDAGNRLWEKTVKLVYIVPRKKPDEQKGKEEIEISYIELLKDIKTGYLSEQQDDMAKCIVKAFEEIFENSVWRKMEYGED